MNNDVKVDKREQIAVERFQMIAPLLEPGLDRYKRADLRRKIAIDNEMSERQIYRLESAYKKHGIFGLYKQTRKGVPTKKLPENFNELLAEAIQLKREVPTRSVHIIIRTLELEGKVKPGVLKRTTLNRYLINEGFGQKQLKKYLQNKNAIATKRFCKPNRCMLGQVDIKYGTGVYVAKDGSMPTVYLSSIIDDHSRHVIVSKWFLTQEQSTVTEIYREAILTAGKIDVIYSDNGGQYISTQLIRSCAMLGITTKRARPRSGQSKGKIEKFHQIVDKFLAEARIEMYTSLTVMNEKWDAYRDTYYENDTHDGIKEYYLTHNLEYPETGITPIMEWNKDSRPLMFYKPEEVAEAFMNHETRIVDKGSLISFKGRKYEVDASLIGAKVNVAYDPLAPESLTVTYKDFKQENVRPVVIGEFCSKKQEVPYALKPETSRVINAAVKAYDEKQAQRFVSVLRYSDLEKED